MLIWDNEMACFVFGDLKRRYFDDSTVAARYGIKEVNYSDYYYKEGEEIVSAEVADYAADTAVAAYDDQVATEAVPIVSPYENEGEKASPADSEAVYDVAADAAVPALEDIPVDAPPPPVVELVAAPAAVASYGSNHNTVAYDEAYEEQNQIKQKLAKAWTATFARAAFARKAGGPSILNNKEFLLAQDKNASATLYLEDVGHLYADLFSFVSYRYFSRSLEGFKGLNAQLYMDKEKYAGNQRDDR